VILDTHCHVIPAALLAGAAGDEWQPVLDRVDGRQIVSFRGRKLTSATGEFADAAVMLEQAQTAGISHLLLSPWIQLVPTSAEPVDAARVSRIQNESIAQAAADSPAGRILGLGCVPLQDPRAAVEELGYLMTLPGMCGVEIPASADGRDLGDPSFLPFWEAAASAGALIFVHPATSGLELPALDRHYLWNSVGNPVETAIAATQLVTAGVLERYDGLKILLAHGGGVLLALRGRLRRAHQVRSEARADTSVAPDELLRRLYFDSLVHDEHLLRGLVEFAGAGHVLLGSDRPFDMGTERPVQEVRALALDPRLENLILGGNAQQLLRPGGNLRLGTGE
jgi:aminocarboxymuconate-semialdehyde decarboxylase